MTNTRRWHSIQGCGCNFRLQMNTCLAHDSRLDKEMITCCLLRSYSVDEEAAAQTAARWNVVISTAPLTKERKGRRRGRNPNKWQVWERRGVSTLSTYGPLWKSVRVCAWECERERGVEGVIRSTLKSISYHNYSELLITKSFILHHLWVHGTHESSCTLSSPTKLAKPLFLHRRTNFSRQWNSF